MFTVLVPSVTGKDPLTMESSVKSNKALEKTMPKGESHTQGPPLDIVRIPVLSPLLQPVICLSSSIQEYSLSLHSHPMFYKSNIMHKAYKDQHSCLKIHRSNMTLGSLCH